MGRVRLFSWTTLLLLVLAHGLTAAPSPAPEATPPVPNRCGIYAMLKAGAARLFGSTRRAPPDATISEPLAEGAARPVTTSEATLEKDYHERIKPLYDSGTRGYFLGKDGVPIHHAHWEVPNAKGTVLLLHGATESMGIYAELIYNLTQRGYNVYALDHRGHGHSGRLSADPHMLFVNKFSDYVDDVETYVNTVMKPAGHDKFSIVSSSMGAQVGLQYTQQHPDQVEKYVGSTPMLGIKFPYGMTRPMAQALASSLKYFGRAENYAPGQSRPPNEPALANIPAPLAEKLAAMATDYWLAQKAGEGDAPKVDMADLMASVIGALDFTQFKPDPNAGSQAYQVIPEGRDRTIWQMRSTDPLTWGISVNWTATATRATQDGWSKLAQTNTPTLFLKAGRDERVQNDKIDKAVQIMPNASLKTYPESGHSLLRTPDSIRDQVMRDLFTFLEAPPPSGTP